MRNVFLILFISVFQAYALDSYSQNTKLTLNLNHVPIANVLEKIEDSSEFYFLYNAKLIDVKREVSIIAENEEISAILSTLFSGTGVSYQVIDRRIILSPGEMTSLTTTIQQQSKITGIVTGEDGTPLPGVSVVTKGTTQGTITDVDGNYSLSNVPGDAILVFSFVGMKTQEIAVAGKAALDVIMREETVGIEEVVAVGYGTQKKINLTGSISSIDADQLSNRPITRISSALQGQMAGVSVVNGSGLPGSSGTIRIRGIGTMNNSDPMVIVDGVETSMNDINPTDIERIDVLKDAASAAIYGTRAANGVIIITTKRGKAGKIKISYNTYLGKQTPTALTNYLSSYDYAQLYNEGLANEGKPPLYSAEALKKFKDGSDPYNYPNTDWLDAFFQGSGLQQNHAINATGGTEQSRYMLSIGYLEQDGLIKNTNYDRYNLRFNLDSKVSDELTIGLNSTLINENAKEPLSGSGDRLSKFFNEIHRIPPTIAIKNENGLWNHYLSNNPVGWAEEGGKYQAHTYKAIGSLFAELKIVKGLILKGIASGEYSIKDQTYHVTGFKYSDGIEQGPISLTDNIQRTRNITLQSFLTYENTFGNHYVKGLLGIDRESFRYDFDQTYRKDLPSKELTEINAGASDGQVATGSGYEARLGSYFGRINYNYKGKYLAEFNLRRDGSSKFSSAKRWGMFPSGSVAWRISEESFTKNIAFLSNLKLRGSYGVLGNHRTDDYLYIPKLTLGQKYPLDGSVVDGAAVTSAANTLLTWEVSTEYNIGLDIGFLNEKLSLSFEYYNRYTDDILTTIPVAAAFGLSSPVKNIGAMRNKGFEFLVNYKNEIGQFSYNASFNFGVNNNNVEKWPAPAISTNIRREGDSWLAYYGYEWIGYFQNDEELANDPKPVGQTLIKGDLKYKDQNGDKKIDSSDRIVLGNSFPGITYGLNFSANYKNFDLSLFLQGAGNVMGHLDHEAIWPFFNGGKVAEKHLDRWSPDNPDAAFPVTRIEQGINDQFESSFNIRNASYLRLKNLQIGYTLPKIKKLPLSKVRMYISGENLLTITNYWDDFDPETPDGARYNYPQVKTFTTGININF